jgi:hypothetical protein
MTTSEAGPALRREIGTFDCGRPGPTLLVLAGIHGNEPAGVVAARRVLGVLQERELPLAGRLVVLAGNVAALRAGVRYQSRDLNRGWTHDAIEALRARPVSERSPEDHEQAELLDHFEAVTRTASGPVVFVDLHTSSADGAPFLCLADTIDNRRLGLSTGVPIILGIEETIDGASLEWFAARGIAGFAVEGGRHQHEDTPVNLEAVLWRLLVRLRLLRPGDVDLAPHEAQLARTSTGVPPIVEIVHRRALAEGSGFRMEPGFQNFSPVQKGKLLATDKTGPIHAPYDCRVLLPLYQEQGDDGFFLARPVRPFWLSVARWMRACGLPRVLPWLPGVRRDPADEHTLLVDRRVARWFTVEVFHLLGYRKERARGPVLAFSRRASRRENRRL